jgi:macrolide transport system ATP-binding/permease protein
MEETYIDKNEVIFMTMMLNLQGISKEFGETNVLKDVSLNISLGDRVGLVGINGAGKSTLANIIYGSIKGDGGNMLWYKKDIEIGYLKQDSFYCQRTWSGQEIDIKVNEYSEDYLEVSSYLGINKINPMEQERLRNLSGGEKMKMALANIWSFNPDFLILDEPTNHLDYQGMQWLIEELKKYKGTILIISHDRYFLDCCVNKIFEVNKGTVTTFYGNYSFYKEEKRKRYESQLHQYEIQESTKAKIEQEINRLKEWSDKGHRESTKKEAAGLGKKEYFRKKAKKKDKQVKSRIKSLEKIDLDGVEKPEEDKKIDFKFNDAVLKKNRVVEAIDIKKSFNSEVLFKATSFFIMSGERVGVFGSNGCGKSTLLKILLGKESLDEGELFISSSMTIGYLSQETLEADRDKTVIELFEINNREEEGKIRILLANMGFDEKMINQQLSTLSLGEVTRVRMTKIIYKHQDILVLDEPLNHLDIYSREKLEDALKDYDGTIILVSHDRYMIEKVCDCLLVFENNKIKKILGSPKEYLDGLFTKNKKKDKKKMQNEKEIKEQKMLLENEIAYIVGELSKVSQGTPIYDELDNKFKELISRKRELEK